MGEIWSRISFCFSIFRCFDWLQWEHGTKSCSKRNIRECKQLGIYKTKDGQEGVETSLRVFSSYSPQKGGLRDNRSECTRTGDVAARAAAGDASRVAGLASFAALF